MKFCSNQEDIYGKFLCKYDILTKTGTYLSLKLNFVFVVNFREKIENFYNYSIRKSILYFCKMILWYKYNAWDVLEPIHMTNLRKC